MYGEGEGEWMRDEEAVSSLAVMPRRHVSWRDVDAFGEDHPQVPQHITMYLLFTNMKENTVYQEQFAYIGP
jgi:hypothetical protein